MPASSLVGRLAVASVDAVDHRPSLDPAVAEIRRAVRAALATVTGPVLVGLSGGADSLALAAATLHIGSRENGSGASSVQWWGATR